MSSPSNPAPRPTRVSSGLSGHWVKALRAVLRRTEEVEGLRGRPGVHVDEQRLDHVEPPLEVGVDDRLVLLGRGAQRALELDHLGALPQPAEGLAVGVGDVLADEEVVMLLPCPPPGP